MGGTGSVLQHDEKTTYSKAEETGLLRLYNRKHREKKGLSGKLGALGIKIEQFEVRLIPTFQISILPQTSKVTKFAHHPFQSIIT